MRLQLAFFLLLATGAFLRADDPDAAHVAALIHQLDADSHAERDAATKELEALGDAVLPALQRAASEGSPESRGRAALIVRAIRRNAVFGRPGNEALKALAATGGSSMQRRIALHDWILSGKRNPRLVESALDLLEFDPEGPECGIGLEALNLLLAPREVASLNRSPEISPAGEMLCEKATTALAQVKILLEGRDLIISDEATRKLEVAAPAARDKSVLFPTTLSYLSDACDGAGVVLRANDTGQFRVELVREAIAARRAEWGEIAKDSPRRISLGIDSPTVVTSETLPDWLKRLEDRDDRVSRLARRTLREVPEELMPQLENLAKDGPGLKLLNTLRLRHKGRVLYSTGETLDESLWIMNGDGSGLRRISGDIHGWTEPAVRGAGGNLYAEGGRSRHAGNIYILDPEGRQEPRLLRADAGLAVSGRQAAPWLFVWNKQGTCVWNAETDKTEKLPVDTMSAFDWSCQGECALAGQSGDTCGVWIWRPGSEARLACRLPTAAEYVRWSPDGTMLACQPPASRGGNLALVLVDPSNGKIRELGTLNMDGDQPEWSPDGKEIAFCSGYLTTLLNLETGRRQEFDKSLPPSFSRTRCWSSDGKALCLFGSPGNGPGIWVVDHDTLKMHRVKGGTYFAQWAFGGEWLIEPYENELWLVRADGPGESVQLTDSIEDLGVFLQMLPDSK